MPLSGYSKKEGPHLAALQFQPASLVYSKGLRQTHEVASTKQTVSRGIRRCIEARINVRRFLIREVGYTHRYHGIGRGNLISEEQVMVQLRIDILNVGPVRAVPSSAVTERIRVQ